MSADDYLYIQKTPEGDWVVTVEFASDEEERPIPPNCVRYKTWAEAYVAAQKRERDEPYGFEYGIKSDPAEVE